MRSTEVHWRLLTVMLTIRGMQTSTPSRSMLGKSFFFYIWFCVNFDLIFFTLIMGASHNGLILSTRRYTAAVY